MLVLSRQRDETIMIGDEIEITVVDIRGDKVRLGISAPTRVSVHRKEVYEAIKVENQKAAAINNGDLDILHRTIAAGPQRTARPGGRLTSLATLRPRPGQAPGEARTA
ncbi:MAG: carbon storage regulator CsrA [Phycisphaerales bacterium]|nr:carbon storage regulator CsrA [Phycisphaerales bacterium]